MQTLILFSLVIILVAVVFHSFVLVGLVRSVYRLSEAAQTSREGSPANAPLAGKPVPEFAAIDTTGTRFTNEDLVGDVAALLFISPSCDACAPTLREIRALGSRVDGNVVVVCQGSKEDCLSVTRLYEIEAPVILDTHRELTTLFAIPGLPTAVLVGSDGVIRSYGTVVRDDELEAVLAEREEARMSEVV